MAIGAVMGIAAAADAAVELNVSGFSPSAGHQSRWSRVAGMGSELPRTVTPAEELRRRLKVDGLHNLALDEQQW